MSTFLYLTEEKLLQSERRFRAFIENSPLVAYLNDQKGGLLYYNQSFARAFQPTAASLLGKTVLDRFPAELARPLHDNDVAALAAAQPLERVERLPHPDGSVRSWLMFKFPVEGDLGGRCSGDWG